MLVYYYAILLLCYFAKVLLCLLLRYYAFAFVLLPMIIIPLAI